MNRARRFRPRKAVIAGLATTLLMFGGSALAAPSAQADPCPAGKSCQHWCPGDPNPAGRPVPWDGNVCHDFFWDYYGVHDIGTGAFYSWRDMPWR
ncbi:hypothetical protein [Mycobacterium sp. 852002-51057_SCH5723018]|uniref:hypothetical protein n=1 Tax=Mycobacterium sp. 852002-51057_SCH5723018 TaxID=1834094 RepID=UPI000A792A5A|nr:hypothetical protein [Mycobacterium sp. 852002-51057_SCH5723018]